MAGSSTLTLEHLAQHKQISTIRKLLDYYNNAPLMLPDEEPDPESLIAGLKNFVCKLPDETGCIISEKIRFLFLNGYEPLVEFGQGEKAFGKLLTSLPKILALSCSESMDKQLNTSQRVKVAQQKSNQNFNGRQNDNRIVQATTSREIPNDKRDSRSSFKVSIIKNLVPETHHQNKDQNRSNFGENIENGPLSNNNYEEQFRNKVEDWLLNKNVENPESVGGNSTPNTERLLCERQMTPVDHQQESKEIPNHTNNNQQQQLLKVSNSGTIKKVNPLQCIYCKKILGRKHHLEVHLRSHTGERPFKCRFSNCSAAFASEYNCRGHENTSRLHEIDRERERMEQLIKSKNSINSNQRAEQQKTILALPQIPSCTNTMNEMTAQNELSGESGNPKEESSSENKDVKNKEGKNPLRCQFCLRKFLSIPSKDFHEKRCSEGPKTNSQLPSASNQLNSPFNTNLQSSRKNAEQDNLEEETDHEMEISSAQIGNDTSLQTKPRARPQHWPVESRTCPDCGKIFSRRDGLLNHVRTHTGERPFKCSWCLKSFTTQDYLKQHARIHTGEKRYPCSICERRFTFSNTRKIHMLSVHKVKLQRRTKKSEIEARELAEESGNNSEEDSNFDDEMAGNSRQLRKSIRTASTEKNYNEYEEEEENEDYFVPGRNSTKSNCKGHLECEICGQNNFGYPSQLAAHIRSHTKPFECKFCSGRFAEQRFCTRHEASCQPGTDRGNQRTIEKRAASETHVNASKRLRIEKSSAASSSDSSFLHSPKNSVSGHSSTSVSAMPIFSFQENTFFCKTANCTFASTSESELQSHLSIEHGLPPLSPTYPL